MEIDSVEYYLKEIAKQLLSLKSASRMTKQDQQSIEDIITKIIPPAQYLLKTNVKNYQD